MCKIPQGTLFNCLSVCLSVCLSYCPSSALWSVPPPWRLDALPSSACYGPSLLPGGWMHDRPLIRAIFSLHSSRLARFASACHSISNRYLSFLPIALRLPYGPSLLPGGWMHDRPLIRAIFSLHSSRLARFASACHSISNRPIALCLSFLPIALRLPVMVRPSSLAVGCMTDH
jgi:hypothetical protein